MKYVYKNTKGTFTGWTIPEDCVQVSDEDYQKLINDELEWKDGKLVEVKKEEE